MTTPPQTRYAKSGGLNIAWSMGGEGPHDILFCTSWTSHVEAFWDWAPFARIVRRLATLGRVILFDLPGNGLSDPVASSQLPTIEQWMDHVRVVMDAADSERAVLFTIAMGSLLGVPFAATHPDRVSALVLHGGFARFHRAEGYDFAVPEERREAGIQWWLDRWGTGRQLELTAPDVADDPFEVELMGRTERYCASPGVASAYFRLIAEQDVRKALPAVHVPTLVMNRSGDRWISPAHGKYLADRIAGSKYVELPGTSHYPFYGDTEAVVTEVRSFLGSLGEHAATDRVLATLLFTDIVGSTAHAARLGDAKWRSLLEQHHALVRQQLARFRGQEIDTTGDGFFATFDGAARAARCAIAIGEAVRALGLHIRAGVHTGEVERIGANVAGVAVHAAARIAALAGSDQVLASQTVKDLTTGSGLRFEDRGSHTLKGVPGEWTLYAVSAE